MKRVLASLVAAGMLLGACSSAATPPVVSFTPEPTSTPMPAPTTTPRWTPQPQGNPNAPKVTQPPRQTSTPTPFAISDPSFAATSETDCSDVSIAVTAVDGDSLSVTVLGGSIALGAGGLTIWCPGATHTWKGNLTFKGYKFASDTRDPLRFMVDKDLGYVYVSGKGSVTFPNGKVVHLPN